MVACQKDTVTSPTQDLHFTRVFLPSREVDLYMNTCIIVLNISVVSLPLKFLKFPVMDLVLSILGSVASEACCLFCFSIDCCNIGNTLRFNSKRKALEEETEDLVELRDKVKHEVETCEGDGESVKTQVKEWLGEVETFMVEVKSLETNIKDYERRQHQSRCSCHCSQRCKFSKEVGVLLKEVRRLTCAGSFNTSMVDHGPGPSTEDKAAG
ncbi:hypothetical protein ACOSP7_030554 [Xanthoceras sorbifolium]